MEAREPTLQPLAAVDPAALLGLLATSLGAGPAERGLDWWRWKHQSSPFGPSPGLVALAAGRPIALRVFLPWQWRTAGRLVPAMRAVDTATHPRWQRRGLFRRLTTELLEQVGEAGAAFVYNTPNAASGRGYLAMGWQEVGRIPVLLALRRPARALLRLASRRRERSGAPALAGMAPVSALLAERRLAGFLERLWPDEPRLHTPRSPEYLAWRYAQVPGLAYRAAWQLGERGGAIVVGRERRRRGLQEVAVCEALASDDPHGRATLSRLLGELRRGCGADYLVATAAAGTLEAEALRRAGFRRLPAIGRRLVARPLRAPKSGLPDPTHWSSWRLQLGDLELF